MRLEIFVLIIVILQSCGSYQNLQRDKDIYKIGNRKVKLLTYRSSDKVLEDGSSNLLYFNMHDNENTSVQACLRYINQYGGTLVELKHKGSRNLSFKLKDGKRYMVDPNRIYTENGIEATLKNLGPYSEMAKASVAEFKDQILKVITENQSDPIVALHNNTEDNYSLLSYLKGAIYDADASETYVNPKMDPDDFYFVTDSILFENMANEQINVVLQDNENATDDGSLSIYCGQKGIRYVNVEAQHGHEGEQYWLLYMLNVILAERKKVP